MPGTSLHLRGDSKRRILLLGQRNMRTAAVAVRHKDQPSESDSQCNGKAWGEDRSDPKSHCDIAFRVLE